MSDSVLAVLGQKHAVRVLHYLRSHEGARFTQIQKALRLNPAQVDRALKALDRDAWIVARTETSPRSRRILVRYSLTGRGKALLKAFDGLRTAAERQRPALGDAAVDELAELII